MSTGIAGLDEVTEGGLPRGRPTLVCGSAGSGKTLLGMESIVRGIVEFDEPGVFMSFEETAEELAKNVASLGFDVSKLIDQKKMAIDYVHGDLSNTERVLAGLDLKQRMDGGLS
jgi:circadian clock protein KaiC